MPERLWTVSNLLSVLRVVLVLPAWYCLTESFPQHQWWAAAILVLAIATDFLDGYLARQLHQVSDFGKILDPLADKVAAIVVTYALVQVDAIPLWFFLIVLLRDLLIVLGGLYIRNKKKIIVQSNWPGKVAVSAVAVYVLLSTVKLDSLETFRMVTLWFSLLMMTWSLAQYSQRLFIGRHIEAQ